MSLRKGLTLILLAAFGLTTVAPAFAIRIDPDYTFQTIAQDDGVAGSGAKPDIIPVDLDFDIESNGDIVFGTDSTDISDADETASFSGAGAFTGAGTTPPTLTSLRTTLLNPPTGCAFVGLPGYVDVEAAGSVDLDTGNNGIDDEFVNVTVDNPTLLPSGGSYIVAQVLTAQPVANTDSNLAASGVLAIHAFTANDSAFNNTGVLSVTLKNIGLSCPADSSASAINGTDLNVTVFQGNESGYGAALPQLPTTLKIAEYGENKGKLEAIIAGTTTGTETTATEEDNQESTITANTLTLNSQSIVTFGPSEETQVSSTLANLDIDAILIRAAEQPNSTASNRIYYETPFATAEFVTEQNLDTDDDALRDAVLTSSSLFDNISNALITVNLAITQFDGTSTSSATLDVTNAWVGLERPTTASATVSTDGFLGALINPVTDNGSTEIAASTDAALVTVDPGAADGGTPTTAFFLVDGLPLNPDTLLLDEHGFVETGTSGPIHPDATLDVAATDVSPSAVGVDEFTFTSITTERAFLFPGVVVDDTINAFGGVSEEILITDTTTRNATTTTFALDDDAGLNTSDEFRNSRTVFSSLRPADNATHGVQYHMIQGSDGGASQDNTEKSEFLLGVTNLAADAYATAARVEGDADNGGDDVADTGEYTDNVVLASKLTESVTDKQFTVHILPFVNKFDGIRDQISVRAKGTITMNETASTEGVKLIATVSGNNLPAATTSLELASIIPEGGFTSAITGRILPVTGDMANLMAHEVDDVSTNRTLVDVSAIAGNTTTTDNLTDYIATLGNNLELDDTVPPLFGGGIAGNKQTGAALRGPVGFVQPKGRALALEETNDGDFKAITDLGDNVRLRVKLPVGADFNFYNGDTSTANIDNVVSIFATGAQAAPTIVNGQQASSVFEQAFVDIQLGAPTVPTNSTLRGIYLVFKPDALVIPSSLTDLNLTVEVIDNAGTNTVDATTLADDSVLTTLASVPLAPELSNFLTVSFSPQATSAYTASTPTGQNATIRSVLQDTFGSQNTMFDSPISTVTRFVNSGTGSKDMPIWNLDITEAVADAFPVGTNLDGVPQENTASLFVDGFTSTSRQLACAFNTTGITAGINQAAAGAPASDFTPAASVLYSDSSIQGNAVSDNAVGIGDDANGFIINLTPGSVAGSPRPSDVATTVTVRNIKINEPDNSPPTPADIACWFQVADATDEVVIGSTVPKVFAANPSVSTDFIGAYTTIGTIEDQLVTQYFTGNNGATTVTATAVDLDTQTHLDNAVFSSSIVDSTDFFDNALNFVVDDSASNLGLLDSSTPVTITSTTLPQINGADDTTGDVQVTVSAAAGTLQPGTLIRAVPSSPSTESVVVPVLDDGSFKAVLRAAPDAIVTLTQSPTTDVTGANIQLRVLNVADAGETPDPTDDKTITGPVATALTSSLVEGQIVVLFDAPATTNFTFADVESTATVNGVAVTKLGDKYAAVVTTTGTYTLAVTVDGETVSTTLDVTTTEKSKKGSLKNLKALKTDKNGRYVLKQRSGKLPNDLDLEIVYSDGTTAVVANADLSRNRRGVVKFDNPESDKTISYVQLLSAKKGSRVAQ